MALCGIRVIELAGIAPAPFCGAILADFGATVIRVDKIDQSLYSDFLGHGKKSVAINLKNSTGVEIFRRLCKNADILIEPFRKGVMENFALGPQELLTENKRLIYARLTGFGQKGTYSKKAGHDINHVAMSGLMSMLGWESDRRPSPPLNLVASFAGGSLLCALGIMMALAERTRSGQGQVVDCSMVAGSAYLASWIFRGHGSQLWSRPRAKNLLDGGAFFYNTYKTKDGNWMAVGAIEPQFYSQLINGLGLDEEQVPQICSAEDGEKFRKLFAQIFKSKTRSEWCEIFDGLDACVTPILSLEEAALNQHNIDNKTFSKNDDGAFSPNPAPILSRTPAETNFHKCNPGSGDDTEQILVNYLGYSKTDVERFEDLGAIMRSKL